MPAVKNNMLTDAKYFAKVTSELEAIMTTAANILWALDQMIPKDPERPVNPDDVDEFADTTWNDPHCPNAEPCDGPRQEGVDKFAWAIANDLVRRLKRGDYNP